jgi:hypothetical protein
MKIVSQTANRLEIAQPNSTFKAICSIAGGIGIIGTVAVVWSGEGLVNGIIFYLLLAAAALGFKFGGKPDAAVFDKERGLIEVTTFDGSFSKPEKKSLELSAIRSVEMDSAMIGHSSSSLSGRTGHAIVLTLDTEERLAVTPYASGKRKCEAVFRTVEVFLEQAPTPL